MDYDFNIKANTGAFELAYKGVLAKTSNTPTSTNQLVASKKSNKSLIDNAPTELTKWNLDPANLIKEIGYGMKQTLEDLLNVLKREKRKRENATNQDITTIASSRILKIHQSVETLTSNACMETQTLSTIKIVEIDPKDDIMSIKQTNGSKMFKNSETNTRKYTKEYILHLLKKNV